MTSKRSFSDFILKPTGRIGIIVVLLIALLGNAIYSLRTLPEDASAWDYIRAGGESIVLIFILWIYERRQTKIASPIVAEIDQPKRHRGLIVLVGIGRQGEGRKAIDEPAWRAISHHLGNGKERGLEFCWMIASDAAMSFALELQQECKKRRVEAEPLSIDNAWNVQRTYERAVQVYEVFAPQLGLSESDIIADVTGGTSPMSVGLALACGNTRPMEYLYGPPASSVPRKIEFEPTRRRQ